MTQISISQVRSLFLSSHLPPVVSVTTFTSIFAYFAGQRSEIFLLAPVVLLGQLAVGWNNDYVDRTRDALAKRIDKPIAQGKISPNLVKISFIVSLIGSGVLGFFYAGVCGGLLNILAISSAFAYNNLLKNTRFSVLPFMVSFGLLPVVVTLGDRQPYFPAVWMIVAVSLFGVAGHFQNVVPDFAEDKKNNIKGLVHYFSQGQAILISMVIIAIALAVIVVGTLHSIDLAHKLLYISTVILLAVYCITFPKNSNDKSLKLAMLTLIILVVCIVSTASKMQIS